MKRENLKYTKDFLYFIFLYNLQHLSVTYLRKRRKILPVSLLLFYFLEQVFDSCLHRTQVYFILRQRLAFGWKEHIST